MKPESIIEEVPGLYKIVALDLFRKTPGVTFDIIPHDFVERIDSIDRVIHQHSAVSPGPLEDVESPWYMHEFQDDNLIVLHGTRYVEIYTPTHGKIEHFVVSPDTVLKNGEEISTGSCMLVWPKGVFHRIRSGENGSASINFAVHYEGYDPRVNFNIYDLDTDTGEYRVLREGHLDQSSD